MLFMSTNSIRMITLQVTVALKITNIIKLVLSKNKHIYI